MREPPSVSPVVPTAEAQAQAHNNKRLTAPSSPQQLHMSLHMEPDYGTSVVKHEQEEDPVDVEEVSKPVQNR